MALELQIRSSTMAQLVADTAQANLRTTCFAGLGPVLVDHVDVGAAGVQVASASTPGKVALRLPLDVYVVSRAAVLAAPNGVPAGATTIAGTVTVVLELGIENLHLLARVADLELGAATGLIDHDALLAAISTSPLSTMVDVDLVKAFASLPVPAPTSGQVELAGGTIAVRLDAAGPAEDHLFGGQDWGLFVDGPGLEALARSLVPPSLPHPVTSFDATPHWRPAGATPHVDVDFSGNADVPDPLSGHFDGTFAIDFTCEPVSVLRASVHYSLDIDAGALVPSNIEGLISDFALAQLDPTKFGGVPAGQHAFYVDKKVPPIALAGATLRFRSVAASPAGMTLGGPVDLAVAPSRGVLAMTSGTFADFWRLELCSDQAKVGQATPDWTTPVGAVHTGAGATLEGCGELCSVEIVSPGGAIAPYLTAPAPGTATEGCEVSVSFPAAVTTSGIGQVTLIITTARGIRYVDLGTPPVAQVNGDGMVLNGRVIWVPNCPDVPVGTGEVLTGDELKQAIWHSIHDPLSDPDPVLTTWTDYLAQSQGLVIQVVTVSDLVPGEVLQFTSPDHAITVAAGAGGEATVPVVLRAGGALAGTSLRRVGGAAITQRQFSVQSVALRHQATFAHEAAAHVDEPDLTSRLRSAASRLRAAPAAGPMADRMSAALEALPHLASIVSVPGFPDTPVAVATLADGSKCLLDLTSDAGPRVAGTFAGPIGELQIDGDLAAAVDETRVSLYSVT